MSDLVLQQNPNDRKQIRGDFSEKADASLGAVSYLKALCHARSLDAAKTAMTRRSAPSAHRHLRLGTHTLAVLPDRLTCVRHFETIRDRSAKDTDRQAGLVGGRAGPRAR